MREIAISDVEFGQFRELMRRVAGVDLPESRRHLVSGRLSRRLRATGLASYGAYYQLVCGGSAPDEYQRMLDLLTTHETYFFREPRHLEHLAGPVLQSLPRARAPRVWSAACSSGEEAYSIAMVLMDRLGEASPWEVFGSDLSREVLVRARSGVYPGDRIDGIPPDYLRRFCRRGAGSTGATLEVEPALRQRVRFAQVNLNDSLSAVGEFDVIFLRNVLIYFDAPSKQQIVARVVRQLRPGGWLFTGHSESLSGVRADLRQERPSIYRRVPA